ncbi:MAG: potassium channel family protein [Candidatus Berkelbacteria bacterium]
MKRKRANLEIYIALSVVLFILLVGTIFYRYYEELNWTDAFYFTTMTVVTVGFGDLAPTKPISRLFTSFYALVSIPAILFSLGLIIEGFLKRRIEHIEDDVTRVMGEESEILRREKKILEEEAKIEALEKK